MHLRRELTREVIEKDSHRARIGSRQSQSKRLVGAGPAGGKQIQARVALIDNTGRAHPSLVPDPRGPPLLPDTCLILAPDLKAPIGMLSREGLQPRWEFLF